MRVNVCWCREAWGRRRGVCSRHSCLRARCVVNTDTDSIAPLEALWDRIFLDAHPLWPAHCEREQVESRRLLAIAAVFRHRDSSAVRPSFGHGHAEAKGRGMPLGSERARFARGPHLSHSMRCSSNTPPRPWLESAMAMASARDAASRVDSGRSSRPKKSEPRDGGGVSSVASK